MGDKTYAEFQTNLLFNLGNRSDVTTEAADWVNRAYRTLYSMKKFGGRTVYFPELETSAAANTVAGVVSVATPTDCLFIHHVDDTTSDVKLTGTSLGDYVKKTGRAVTASRAAPKKWVRHAALVLLNPTPDAVYALKIYYRKRPIELAGVATTVIGEEWDEPILLLATYQSMMRMNEFDKAKAFKEEWQSCMSDLVGIYDAEDMDKKSIRYPNAAWINNSY